LSRRLLGQRLRRSLLCRSELWALHLAVPLIIRVTGVHATAESGIVLSFHMKNDQFTETDSGQT
jgi:hypothetical protein